MAKVKISDGSSAPEKKVKKESKLTQTHKVIIGACVGVVALCICAVGFAKDYKAVDEQNAYTISAGDPASLFQEARDEAE